jgi:membrane dipeptidase
VLDDVLMRTTIMKQIIMLLAVSVAAGAGLAARPQQSPAPAFQVDQASLARARQIQDGLLTVDTHVDIGGGAEYATPALDPGGPTNLKCDLPKMKAGGLDAVFLAVFVSQRPDLNAEGYKRAYESAIVGFDALDRLVKLHPELCEFGRTPADVARIAKTGRRVILTGVENGYPMGDDFANLKTFYDRGARYMTLVHTSNNQLATSSGARDGDPGLTELGKRTVLEMNRLGMMVDLSHASARSFWDAIAISKTPIIESHSGCMAVAKHDRNLDDDQLKALAKKGGVIQIVALSEYLKEPSPERLAATEKLRDDLGYGRGGRGGRGQGGPPATPQTPEQRAEMAKLRATYQERMKEIDARFPGATLKDFVDHIDHAVKVAGIDHVGIGTDFDGGGGVPGFNDHSEAVNVTAELLRRGYTEPQIRKIWGENLLRVWLEVEKAKGN